MAKDVKFLCRDILTQRRKKHPFHSSPPPFLNKWQSQSKMQNYIWIIQKKTNQKTSHKRKFFNKVDLLWLKKRENSWIMRWKKHEKSIFISSNFNINFHFHFTWSLNTVLTLSFHYELAFWAWALRIIRFLLVDFCIISIISSRFSILIHLFII